MIDVKELRIGNLVKYDNREFSIHTIAKEFPTLDTSEFGIGVVDWNNLEPIELTEEWLIKFGYTKIFDDLDRLNRYGIVKDGVFRYGLIVTKKGICYPTSEGGVFLEFVHQLQNLIFALTNEELTIKN